MLTPAPTHSYHSPFPPETLRVCDAGAVNTIRIRLVERMSGALGVSLYILISIETPAGRSRLERESIVRSEGSIMSIKRL